MNPEQLAAALRNLQGTPISRVEGENYLDTVVRSLTMNTQDIRTAGYDFHVIDYDAFMSVAASENTPLSVRLARINKAKDIEHFWLERTIPGTGSISPLSEGAVPSVATANKPARYSNVLMAIGKRVDVSLESQVIAASGAVQPAVNADLLGDQLDIQSRLLARDQERALIEGKLSSSDPRQAKGLLGDYRNASPDEHGWIQDYGTTLDMAAAQLTSTNIEDQLNTVMRTIAESQKGPLPNALYVPSKVLSPLMVAAKAKLQITVPLSELQSGSPRLVAGGAIGKFYCDFGSLDIIWHPMLTAAASADSAAEKAKSRMLFLYEPGIKLVDYAASPGIKLVRLAPQDLSDNRILFEWFTLETRYLGSHAQISNFYV